MNYGVKIDWEKRMQNPVFWVAIFSFIALTGSTFGLYSVPAGYETWVNGVLTILSAIGIITDPTTQGISDNK